METSQLAEQLIAECQAIKSTKLDLGYCGLREIPVAVFEMVWLEELYLCNGYFDFNQQAWVHSENGGHPNCLNLLPEGLGRLKKLNILFAGGCSVRDSGHMISYGISDISILQNLTELTHLDLPYNRIQDISCLQNLTRLTHLNLRYNRIQDISIVKKLAQLTYLDLRSNRLIKDFSIIQNLKRLTHLNLSYNKLIEDISFIQNLTQLTHLNLIGNKIQDISLIQNLTQLTNLSIGSNKIEDISFIQNLTQLTNLYLRDNKIQDISIVKNLTQLTHLSLSDNKLIKDFSFIQSLTRLTNLSLSSNKIEDISFIQNLTQLTNLYLGFNKIQDISPLLYLPNLKKVLLRKNAIKSIPKNILMHSSLEYLELQNNPLKQIPDEILAGIEWDNNNDNSNQNNHNNAFPDLCQWYADLAKGSIPNYYFKLLMLGNGRVGKSCIVDALQHRNFDPDKKSSHAIILEKWKPSLKENTAEYFIWDFGGQEIYHSTHRWFMRSRAVYLVVWDRVSEKVARIADPLTGIEYDNHTIPYWINTIRANNPDIPILLVENKLDKYNHKPLSLSEKELPQKYRADIEFSRFSAAERKNYLRRLETDILMITESMDEYGQAMPLSWHKVRKRILQCIFNETQQSTLRKLSKTEFETWCTVAEVLPKSAPALLRFLHRTGVVYTDDNLLGDTILIDQQWAIDAIYKVLERGTRFFKDVTRGKGRFAQYSLFGEWLSDKTQDYTTQDFHLFLKFMLSCKLCFRVSDEAKDLGDDNEFAIPQLMPESPPPNVKAIWQTGLPNVYYLEFQYDFLHYATVQDFIVKMGRKTNLEYIWKNGISIPHQESQALVTAAVPEKIIHIRTMGTHRAFLLSAIRNIFRPQIDKDLSPMVRVSNDGLHFVDLEELKKCQAASNENVEVVHKKSLAKSYRAATQFAWALELDEKADLRELPDVVQVTTPIASEKESLIPKKVTNPFIITANITYKGETIKIELPKSMFTIQTPQLDQIEKVVNQNYEINKALYALTRRNQEYIDAIFDQIRIADAQLFDSAIKQHQFYKKVETYFQQLPLADQKAFPIGWQNAPAKDKLKVVLSLGFIKYERELEVKGFALPRTWEEFKGVFLNKKG